MSVKHSWESRLGITNQLTCTPLLCGEISAASPYSLVTRIALTSKFIT